MAVSPVEAAILWWLIHKVGGKSTYNRTRWKHFRHRNKGVERLSCSAYPIRKVPKNRKFLEEFPKPRDLKAGSFLVNEVGRPKSPTLEVNSDPYS